MSADDLTIEEAAAQLQYAACCQRCKDVVEVDLIKLSKRIDPHTPLRDIRHRLRCIKCGHRGPIITTLWRSATTSHVMCAHWKPPRTG